MDWISVKDELPKEYDKYIVYAPIEDGFFIDKAWFDPGRGWTRFPGVFVECITHWMQFPEPPKVV